VTDGFLSRLRARIRDRFDEWRWWYALRVGSVPNCAVCGNDAAWIATSENEPRCFQHIPAEGEEAIRDVQPEDCFTDWDEPTSE